MGIFYLFFFIIVNVSPILASNNNSNDFKIKESVQITNFDDFVIKDESKNITSVKKSNWVYFQNNDSNSEDQSIESYILDFTNFGNITDIKIDLTFNYYFNNSNDEGMFLLHLITKFDEHEKTYTNYTNQIAMTGIQNRRYYLSQYYVVEWFLFTEKIKALSDYPLYDELHYQIKKNNRIVECSVKDCLNNTIITEKWNSELNYVNTHGLILWYSTFLKSFFNLNITSVNIYMEVENRDWAALAQRDKILFYTIGTFGTISLAFLVFLSINFFVKNVRKYKIAKKSIFRNQFDDWNQRNQEIKEAKMADLLYKDKLPENSVCGICKLPVSKEKAVLRCPYCNTFYHSRHLMDWLDKHKECPICKRKIMDS